ncbi:hypothetical protein OPIT5_14995 [Opitutaceae bacterium TAV5]|nr:hypothetical protein OPIT5_14995 [Opitutaceae bacterium TAV5]
MKKLPLFVSLLLPCLPGSAVVGLGQTVWDAGASSDLSWSASDFANWSTDATPAGTAVTFGATGTTANATTVSNIVDEDFTINSLTWNHTSNWHVTEIGAGHTLTVGGAFLVGGQSGNSSLQTRAAFTGAGSLAINDSAATFTVTNNATGSGGNPAAVLDLSYLATFTATVNAFNYGSTTIGSSGGSGTVYLAGNSTITASTLTGGGSGTYGAWNTVQSNRLYLGSSTELNVDTIAFASGRSPGLVTFRAANSGAANASAAEIPTLTVRGSAGGDSRADLSIGALTGAYNPTAGSYTSTADFSAGSVDARVGTLLIGSAVNGVSGTAGNNITFTSKLIIGDGNIDATLVVVGRKQGASGQGHANGTVAGHLEITGGTFKAGEIWVADSGGGSPTATVGVLDISGTANVQVDTNLILGRRANAGEVNATLNLAGGVLAIGGNLTEGTNVTSTVNLSGGVLDLTGGTVTVDTFNQTGGTLRNVATLTVGTFAHAGGVFDNVAAATINTEFSATLDGAFNSLDFTGILTLGDSANLSLTLAADFTPVAGFTLIDGFSSISGTFATINGEAFGASNALTLTNNTGSYDFFLHYNGNDLTLSLVPEPSTWAVFTGLAALCALGIRRRGSRD